MTEKSEKIKNKLTRAVEKDWTKLFGLDFRDYPCSWFGDFLSKPSPRVLSPPELPPFPLDYFLLFSCNHPFIVVNSLCSDSQFPKRTLRQHPYFFSWRYLFIGRRHFERLDQQKIQYTYLYWFHIGDLLCLQQHQCHLCWIQ